MKGRFILRNMAVILAVCLMSSVPVHAAEVSGDEFSVNAAWDITGEDSGREEIPAEVDIPGEDSGQEKIPAETDMPAESHVETEIDAEVVSGEESRDEELTGSYWYYFIETGIQYDFKCNNETDYNCYMFTPEESGTYRVDVMKTTGRVYGKVYTSEDSISLNETDSWTDYYDESGYHITIRMKADLKYVFRIYPDTDRVDKG